MTGATAIHAGVAPLVGPSASPPVLVVAILALLLAVLLGRVILGVAWRLLLVAFAATLVLWLVGTLQTVLVV